MRRPPPTDLDLVMQAAEREVPKLLNDLATMAGTPYRRYLTPAEEQQQYQAIASDPTFSGPEAQAALDVFRDSARLAEAKGLQRKER